MKRFRWDNKYLYWGMTAFCVIIASIVFFMAIERWVAIKQTISFLFKTLTPIIWGLALTYILIPPQRFLENHIFYPLASKMFSSSPKKSRTFSRAVSILFTILVSSVMVSMLLWMVLPQIYTSVQSIVPNLTIYSRNLTKWLEQIMQDAPELEEFLVSLLGELSTYFTNWIRGSLLPQMNAVVSSVSSGFFWLVKSIINVFIGVIVSCYIMYNKEAFGANTKKTLYSFFPVSFVEAFLRIVRSMDEAFTGFLTGKLLDSIIIGCICAIGCSLLKMPYVALISVVIGITNIIPFFGPFIGAIPCAFIILMISPVKCLIFIIFILVLQQVDGNIIGPKILGGVTGLNGFWVLFAILVGGGLFGFAGMICGVPVFTVIYSGFSAIVNSRLKKRDLPTKTTEYMDIKHLKIREREAGGEEPQTGDVEDGAAAEIQNDDSDENGK